MVGAGAAAWVAAQMFPSPVVRITSLRILTEPTADTLVDHNQLSTISKTVTVEIASKAVLDQALKGEGNK
ncbi:Nickel transporter, partial [Operophtera brumata]